MPKSERRQKRRRKSERGKRVWLGLHLVWIALLLWLAPLLSQQFMPAAALSLGPPVFYIPVSVFFVFVALWQGGRWLGAHSVVLLLSLIPLLGWTSPIRFGGSGEADLKVATLNVSGDNADLALVAKWLEDEQIDVLCLQEVNGTENIAQELLKRLDGWSGAIRREVAIISRYPLGREQSIAMGGRLNRDVLGVEVGSPRPVWVVSVHWPAPFLTKGFDRLAEDQSLREEYLAATRQIGEWRDWPTVIAGDFNTPPRHGLYREMNRDYANAFSAGGSGLGYTFSADRRIIRIDHIWLSSKLNAGRCTVGPSLGSDHLPVVAEISVAEKD